jgi:hypothetical protein
MNELFIRILTALLSNPSVLEQYEPDEIIQAALNYTSLAIKEIEHDND